MYSFLQCVTILTSVQKKFESFRRGINFFPFCWGISKKGKKGGNKISKSGGEGDEKGGWGPRFLEKIEGGNRPTL